MDNFNQPSVSEGFWEIKLQSYWGIALIFTGHVTSYIARPLDSQFAVSHRWCIWIELSPRTVVEIRQELCRLSGIVAKFLSQKIADEEKQGKGWMKGGQLTESRTKGTEARNWEIREVQREKKEEGKKERREGNKREERKRRKGKKMKREKKEGTRRETRRGKGE